MPKRFPVTVTEDGVTARIRKFTQVKKGKKYVSFITDYVLFGKHKREWRSNFGEARQAAIDACRMISNGQHLSLTLTDADRMAYLRAQEVLKPIGVKLDVAATEYVFAVKSLPEGVTLKEAVDFFRRCNGTTVEKRTTQQVVNEMLAAKRMANLSHVHMYP